MRIVKQLPPDLTTLIFQAGSRTLVLLEGDSDLAVFEEWYEERLDEIMFYVPGGGNSGVENRLQEVLAHSSRKQAYGIVDRDFRSEEEVETRLQNPEEHLFVLRRYAIENYLLEPNALREELRVFYRQKSKVPDSESIEKELLRYCRSLQTMMASNWVLLEAAQVYYPVGYNLVDRQGMIHQTAIKIGCDPTEAEGRIAEKEALIEPSLTNLETAHCFINGKHLLHSFYKHYVVNVQTGLLVDHLFSLLVRTVKRFGIHPDIKTIIEDRILK